MGGWGQHSCIRFETHQSPQSNSTQHLTVQYTRIIFGYNPTTSDSSCIQRNNGCAVDHLSHLIPTMRDTFSGLWE